MFIIIIIPFKVWPDVQKLILYSGHSPDMRRRGREDTCHQEVWGGSHGHGVLRINQPSLTSVPGENKAPFLTPLCLPLVSDEQLRTVTRSKRM